MIGSVLVGSNAQIVDVILNLHSAGYRVLDTTWGKGNFWMPHQERWQVVGLDIEGRPGILARASYEALPFKDRVFDAVICDPPFLGSGGKNGLMVGKYGINTSMKALFISLQRGDGEFYRVLKPRGILLFKCMDTVEGRRHVWTHIIAPSLFRSFRLRDLFIRPNGVTAIAWNWANQTHAKAMHTYFMVFGRRKQRPGPALAAPLMTLL